MAWQEWTPMEERARFIFEYQHGAETMAGLCRSYGISRKTGYKWLNRYKQEGFKGLKERSRRPGSIPHKTSLEIERLLIKIRREKPNRGPKKLAQLL